MRTLMTVRIPVEAGNKAVKDGTIGRVMETAMARMKPEAAYFTTTWGERTAIFVFNLENSSDMPRIAEPFFTELNAHVEAHPVMNAEDLKAGLSKLK